MLCLRGQFVITEKLTLDTTISPMEIGEQSPLGVINLLANSKHPEGDSKDLDRLRIAPIRLMISIYFSITILIRETESSPKTPYSVNHFQVGK